MKTKLFTNVEPLSKVKSVNDSIPANRIEITDKTFVNKYLTIDKFEKLVTAEEFAFSSPEYWLDPYEQLFYKRPEYHDIFHFDIPDFQAYCFTSNQNRNEDAMWSVYRYNSSEPVIKVTFNLYELLRQINDFCEKRNFTLYIGSVDYSKSQENLRTLMNPDKNKEKGKDTGLFDIYFPEILTVNSYLTLMSLKRKQYNYEGEIRMFIVPDKGTLSGQLKLPFDYKAPNLISSIKIAPQNPCGTDGNKKVDYTTENTEYSDKIKKKIEKILGKEYYSNIQQCHLYESLSDSALKSLWKKARRS